MLVVLAVLVRSAAVVAQPLPDSSMALDWRAPSECPSRTWLLGEVARLLGRPLDARVPPALRVQGEVTHAQGTPYRVLLRTEAADGSGERALEDPACQRIAEAAAVVIALAIDPGAVAQTQSRQQTAPPALPPGRGAVPSERAARFAGGAFVVGDTGTLPQPSVGFGVGVALTVARLVRAEVHASTWLPQDVPAGNGLPGGAHIRMLFLVGARACVGPGWRWVEVSGCLGVEGGVLEAAGFGFSDPTTAQSPWFAASAGPSLVVHPVPWLSLRLAVEGAVPFERPRFTVRAYRGGEPTDLEVHQPAWIVGRASFGVELRY